MDSGRHNRHFRRRVVRQWNKIKIGKPCTKFLERNILFEISHVLAFQAVKVAEDIICVYNVSYFDFNESRGYCERITICQRNGILFRSLASVMIGFVSEDGLEKGEELEV